MACVTTAYGAGLVLDPCDTLVEGACPGVGAQGSCPDGTPCLWSEISCRTQLRTLCSCYTSGCGDGLCNRLVQWIGTMCDMGCYGTELQPCRTKRCWVSSTVVPNQYPNKNCDLDECNGPCPEPVFPL